MSRESSGGVGPSLLQRIKDAMKPKPPPEPEPASKRLAPPVRPTESAFQFKEVIKPRTDPFIVLGSRPGGGTCHGCWHFQGDGPEARRYNPEGKCLAIDRGAVVTKKPITAQVTWQTRACVAYRGWGTWCEKCGAATSPNAAGCACIRPVAWR